MGWFKRSEASHAAVRLDTQDGWFKRNLKKLKSRFGNKSAQAVSEQVKPTLESKQGYEAASLGRRQTSGAMKKRGSFFSRNKLKKLAYSKKLDPQKVCDAMKADAHRGGSDMLKMLNSDLDGLARLLRIMTVDQQFQCLDTFFDCSEGVRTPEEARLAVDLIFRVQSCWPDDKRTLLVNETLLKLTGAEYRPYILAAAMTQAGKYGMLSYGSLQHLTRHHYMQEAYKLQEALERGESVGLGVSPEIVCQFVGGEEVLSAPPPEDPFAQENLVRMQISFMGRLFAAAKASGAPPSLEKLILVFDHLPKKGIPEYNQKYGAGKPLVGVDDAKMISVMDKLTPGCLEEVMAAEPVKVSEVIGRYGWAELPYKAKRTAENATGDFTAGYLREYVASPSAPPPKPLRTYAEPPPKPPRARGQEKMRRAPLSGQSRRR